MPSRRAFAAWRPALSGCEQPGEQGVGLSQLCPVRHRHSPVPGPSLGVLADHPLRRAGADHPIGTGALVGLLDEGGEAADAGLDRVVTAVRWEVGRRRLEAAGQRDRGLGSRRRRRPGGQRRRGPGGQRRGGPGTRSKRRAEGGCRGKRGEGDHRKAVRGSTRGQARQGELRGSRKGTRRRDATLLAPTTNLGAATARLYRAAGLPARKGRRHPRAAAGPRRDALAHPAAEPAAGAGPRPPAAANEQQPPAQSDDAPDTRPQPERRTPEALARP